MVIATCRNENQIFITRKFEPASKNLILIASYDLIFSLIKINGPKYCPPESMTTVELFSMSKEVFCRGL
jgi:hypothetical protein